MQEQEKWLVELQDAHSQIQPEWWYGWSWTRSEEKLIDALHDKLRDMPTVNDTGDIVTIEAFWDCECDYPDHIHYKRDTLYCDKCKSYEDEMPDSRLIEVLDLLFIEKEEN